MIIENPDALKQWLTGYLPPLCDADPEVLAKYCLALVRKDRPNSELKASMLEQLDVFLKSNTEPFVEKFLQVAKSKSYLPKEVASSPTEVVPASSSGSVPPLSRVSGHSPDSTTNAGGITAMTSSSSSTTTCSITASNSILQPPLPPLPPPSVPIPHPPPETAPPYPPPPPTATKKEEVTSSVKSRKSDLDRDKEERRNNLKSRSRGHSRSRSRSRERERAHRSRSRGRSTRNKYEDRRRRSPHNKRYRRSRSRSRSRSPRWSSRSPPRRSRSRDRCSRPRNRPSISPRNRTRSSLSPKRISSRHRTRSRSPLLNNAKSRSKSPNNSPAHNEKEDSPASDTAGGSIASTIVHSVVSIPKTQEHFTAGKTRCRDYDEQGFCMRGDQCQYDHGADPVVLEGGALDFSPPLTGVTSVGYQGGPPAGAPPLSQGIASRAMLRHPPPTTLPRQSQFEYTPNNPSLWPGDTISNPPPFYGRGRGIATQPPRFPIPPMAMDIGRALINVPVSGPEQAEIIRTSLAQRLGPASATHFSGPGLGMTTQRYASTLISKNLTLELSKIPTGLNTISHLNQHFSKFGTITNIQVHHDGDPESALITFSSNSEASAAYRSTEAVLNNRFIKLFWHNPSSTKSDMTSSASAAAAAAQRAVHERLGVRHPNKTLNNKVTSADASYPDKSEKVYVSRGSLVKTVYNPSAVHGMKKEFELRRQLMENKQPASAVPNSTQQKQILDQFSSQLNQNQTGPESNSAPPPVPQRQISLEEIKKRERETIEKQQELLRAEIAAKQKAEKQKAEALKLKLEVEKRTKQLLEKQMQQVKVLLNKFEVNKEVMKPEEKLSLMKTIKSLQAAVDTTRAQLVSSAAATLPSFPKSKAQLDKEILDTELELYTVQSDGGDVSQLRTQLYSLRSQAAQLRGVRHSYSLSNIPNAPKNILPFGVSRGHIAMGPSRGVLRPRGRGRGYSNSFSSVDRRTTSINASGFEREDKEDVLAHFSSFGILSNYNWDCQTPAITVTYSTRREAEKALIEARNLGDRLLTLTWVPDPPIYAYKESSNKGSASPMVSSPHHYTAAALSFGTNSTTHSTTTIASNDDVEEITEEIVEVVETIEGEEDTLLFDDEVDEEEDEGRSWRR